MKTNLVWISFHVIVADETSDELTIQEIVRFIYCS